MQKYMDLLVLIYALGVLGSLKFGCGSVVRGNGKRCIETEKQALLLLKESLDDDMNYLSSWIGDDCCAWHGIACNNRTDHVTQLDLRDGYLRGSQISSSLLDLEYLSYLDLSFNSFDGIQIPEFLGSLKHLTYLNLSYSNFIGLVPHHLGNLSSLRYLDINSYYDDYFTNGHGLLITIDSMRWLSGLSFLEHLDLSYVNLSMATDWFSAINMLPNSVLVLSLVSCELPQNIPHHHTFINLTSLVSLDLANNQLNAFPSWVFNNSRLENLYLPLNHIHGPIPESIGSLTSLVSLGLASNKLSDLVPSEIYNLTKLTYLNMNFNELRGCLPDAFCQLSKLEQFDVNENHLSGNIPKCIGELSNLKTLALHSNLWEGYLTEHHFVNLTGLTLLIISSRSNLVLNVSVDWVPPFQLKFIYLASLKVGPKFPQWLLTQTNVRYIIMQNTSISDSFPVGWFVSFLLSQASVVNLSDNDINGELSLISSDTIGLKILALSNNRLSGNFPAFLCNLTSLSTLVLSSNNFSGELPPCLGNLIELKDFDVMNNSLSGDIPVSLGSLGNLTYLNLHNNKFQGKLPLSFQNLTQLVALDVGKNSLSDILPPWTGEQLPHLKYLILRSNNFYGNIPTQLCHHSSIQILNLARNQITGSIPPCFGKFLAMLTSGTSGFSDDFSLNFGGTIIDDAKGYELKYTSTLIFQFSIDLSYNKISGEIPEELMDLHGLLNLNLAGNDLVGRIPDRIGELRNLEFLDLSRNKLQGSIPQSLSSLNFLSRLNLSFNNLSGRIPTGYQLQTLDDPSIYVGNNQLCGRPILNPCPNDVGSDNVHDYNEADSDSDDERRWFYAGLSSGLFVGFLGFCASLHFINSWNYSHSYFVDQVFDKTTFSITSLRRKFKSSGSLS